MPQPFAQLPKSVTDRGQALRLADGRVPALIVHPHWDTHAATSTQRAPLLLWMHGRTVSKELDPGRYLVLARRGIASCALDLPGHGDRLDAQQQAPHNTLEVIAQMVDEIDAVMADLAATGHFDMNRVAIGGMSAGGMAALARLAQPHSFAAALVECTTGSWKWQKSRVSFHPDIAARLDPIQHLETWRDIPILGLHATLDAWVPIEGQREFFAALQARSAHPQQVVLHEFPETGAPFEHVGFGRAGRAAKELGAEFLARNLGVEPISQQ